jgi:hypothetical protein
MDSNFQTGNNQIKLHTQYENVTKKFYVAALYTPYSVVLALQVLQLSEFHFHIP